jgi:glutamine synthetase
MADRQFKHKEENLKRLGMTEAEINDEITLSKQHIKQNIEKIQDAFVELGYVEEANKDKVKLTIGPELEFTFIAGNEAYKKRLRQILEEMELCEAEGKHQTHNINDKSASYMPISNDAKKLDARFSDPITKLAHQHPHANQIQRTSFGNEAAVKSNTFDEPLPLKDGMNKVIDTKQDKVAASQVEITFPPYSPIGAAEALNVMMDKAINEVDTLGLKRIDFTAQPHTATAPNSIHLNSVITMNGVNTFSKKEWYGRNNPKEAEHIKPGTPSDLLLCIGKEHIEYLKHSLFMFARAESDYKRFEREEVSGPSNIGVTENKQHGKRASAMFRGEGRKTERANSDAPDKPDQGPLRFELRIPCPGAAGHPNKSAYPEQKIFPYQMIEAYTDMLAKGTELWKQRQQARRNDQPVPEILEDALNPETLELIKPNQSILPHNKEIALSNFFKSTEAKEYWGKRMQTIQALSDRLDQINEADRNPSTQNRGAHVERLLTSTNPPHAAGNDISRL